MDLRKNGKDYRFVGVFDTPGAIDNCLSVIGCNDHVVEPYGGLTGKNIKMYKLYIPKELKNEQRG